LCIVARSRSSSSSLTGPSRREGPRPRPQRQGRRSFLHQAEGGLLPRSQASSHPRER
jgi:hypothetical protein